MTQVGWHGFNLFSYMSLYVHILLSVLLGVLYMGSSVTYDLAAPPKYARSPVWSKSQLPGVCLVHVVGTMCDEFCVQVRIGVPENPNRDSFLLERSDFVLVTKT
jgi:hypothetical protein